MSGVMGLITTVFASTVGLLAALDIGLLRRLNMENELLTNNERLYFVPAEHFDIYWSPATSEGKTKQE